MHRMLSFNISYWDFIKFPYFADTIERGDRGWNDRDRGEIEDDFRDNFNMNYFLKNSLGEYN
jgi:hypothetical protein